MMFIESLLSDDNGVFLSGVLCYDDACHLKKFSQNPVRSDLTVTAKKMKGMKMVCDKFHFRNHVDTCSFTKVQ